MTYKVLVVDDQQEYIFMIEKALEANTNPFTVAKAINGLEACALCEKFMPNLILMDWEMPEMSGIEAIRKLKSNPKTAIIPIIMVTSRPKQESFPLAIQAGASDFLEKPFQRKNLIQKVEKVLKIPMVA